MRYPITVLFSLTKMVTSRTTALLTKKKTICSLERGRHVNKTNAMILHLKRTRLANKKGATDLDRLSNQSNCRYSLLLDHKRSSKVTGHVSVHLHFPAFILPQIIHAQIQWLLLRQFILKEVSHNTIWEVEIFNFQLSFKDSMHNKNCSHSTEMEETTTKKTQETGKTFYQKYSAQFLNK